MHELFEGSNCVPMRRAQLGLPSFERLQQQRFGLFVKGLSQVQYSQVVRALQSGGMSGGALVICLLQMSLGLLVATLLATQKAENMNGVQPVPPVGSRLCLTRMLARRIEITSPTEL